jgi:hypothetical protein
VVLPIVNPGNEVFQSFIQEITIDSLVGFLQGSLRHTDASGKISPRRFVLTLLQQVLGNVSQVDRLYGHTAPSYLQKQGILDQALHGLQEEAVQCVEITSNRVLGSLDLVE